MTSRVLLPAVLRPYAGGRATVEAAGSTLDELISDLTERYPALGPQLRTDGGELPVFVNVFIGDQDARYLDGLSSRITEGEEVTILPAVAGGT